MCGIAGILHFQHPQTGLGTKLANMAFQMRHRGPDGEGYLLFDVERAIPAAGPHTPKSIVEMGGLPDVKQLDMLPMLGGFAHRRLSIIDTTEGGHQPITDPLGLVWITFNGEIYNYRELRSKLKALGHQFYTESDSEVLVACWKEYGTSMVTRLDGMWAFAIIDLHKKVFFASRDPIGVKPFFYTTDHQGLTFASEVKTLWHTKNSVYANKEKVAEFLYSGQFPSGEHTFYQDVHQLPPGHSMYLNLGERVIQYQKYHNMEVVKEAGTFDARAVDELAARTRNLILSAVRSRLISDVPLGICLSGGLDSSLIAGAVHHILKQEPLPSIGLKPTVFSVVFPGEWENEWPLTETMVTRTGAISNTVSPTAQGFADELLDLSKTLEMPFGGTNSYSAYCLFRKIGEAGLKATLDGQGADELFAGYSRFGQIFIRQLLKEGHASQLWHELNQTGFKSGSPHKWWLERLFSKWKNQLWLSERRKPHLAFVQNDLREIGQSAVQQTMPSNLNAALLASYPGAELEFMLLASDKLSMRFSVESRVPFSDYMPLARYAMKIPAAYKWRKGRNKFLLYEAAKPFVSDEVYLNREKKGFSTPMSSWLQHGHDHWKPLFTHSLEPWLDVIGIQKSWNKLRSLAKTHPQLYLRLVSVAAWKKAMWG